MPLVMRRATGRMKKGVAVLMSGWGRRGVSLFGLVRGWGGGWGGGGGDKIGWDGMEWKAPTAQQQPNHQKRHQSPLGIMHEIPIPHPRLRLPGHFPLPVTTARVPLRRELGTEMVDEVLDDEAGLREYEWFGGVGGGFDAHEGGFAQWVYFF